MFFFMIFFFLEIFYMNLKRVLWEEVLMVSMCMKGAEQEFISPLKP